MMLTAMVNIAVFAAFSFRVGHVLLVDAAFKPVCASGNVTVSAFWMANAARSRQETARSGTVGGKSGKVRMDSGRIHGLSGVRLPAERLPCLRVYAVGKVLAPLGGAA